MLVKLAFGNVCRSIRAYTVYFLTLTFAACLLYSFLASDDYLRALALDAEQRTMLAKATDVLQGFSVFMAVIFAFLMGYANVFLVRRRKREFGLYALLGMSRARRSALLALECGMVSTASLAAGIGLGCGLSPLFGLLAAFVFGIPWRPAFTLSFSAAWQCAAAFFALALLAAVQAMRSIGKHRLVELFEADRMPEAAPLRNTTAMGAQTFLAALLLGTVWGTCLFEPLYFLVFIIPLGFMATGGTYFLFRVGIYRASRRIRARTERYYRDLTCFELRQIEAHMESSCAAFAAVCVLIAAGMCMIVAGLTFSVGLRQGELLDSAFALQPIAFTCIFHGASFLVVAAAILALQQLSRAIDLTDAYAVLARLGTPAALMRRSVRFQTLVCFAVPFFLACLHCVFGFLLIGALSVMVDAGDFLVFACSTLGLTTVVFALYWLATTVSCTQTLCGSQSDPWLQSRHAGC